MEYIPTSSGSYALHIVLPAAQEIRIGRLGTFRFPAGNYLYTGSAHGPGGLRARLRHHVRPVANPHWHLDFLRPFAVLQNGWYTLENGALECAWSKALQGQGGGLIPARGFGAADCHNRCHSHLVYFPSDLSRAEIEARLSFLETRIMSITFFDLSSFAAR
ncbi:MAG TPA: GIY-YIG nuclease family protein [Anaerolineaceae bacterium]